MRTHRLAAGTGRLVLELARRGDDLFGAGDLKCFESWDPYDRLLNGHGRSSSCLGRDSSPGCVLPPFLTKSQKAALVEARAWYPAQQLARMADGRVRLTFTVANLEPLVSWILEWGPHARALEPPELVTCVVEELDAARRHYGS